MATVTKWRHQNQGRAAKPSAKRTITTRQFVIAVSTTVVSTWAWHHTGGDTIISGALATTTAAFLERHIVD